MTRDELSGTEWTIPAARFKGKREFLVPLSPAALAVLAEISVIGSKGFVFTTSGKKPLGGFGEPKASFDKLCGVEGWTIHGLRRTARSLMSRAGVNADVAERCLGHAISGIRGTYDRYAYLDEKRRALEALASLINRIVSPPADNVVSMRGESR